MDGRRSLLLLGVVLLLGGACDSRPLDPGTPNPGGNPNPGGIPLPPPSPVPLPTPAPNTLIASLQALAGPSSLLVVGTNAGAVARTPNGAVQFFQGDPETLVEAAAVIQMPVCSVELQALAVSTAGGVADGMTIDAALAECDQQDLGAMVDRLNALKTSSTVVVIAANTAITVHSTNGGINYFYGDDILGLLRTARKLYVTACVIAPESLALPTYPEGQTAGLSIDAALASCGRS